jgi:PucR family transcriptional regulator, purine catabolism regulatory protein
VAITVAELVAVPHLRLRLHAGAAGGDRPVSWAHASDLPNATEWLAPDDLLMSNGLNVPADSDEQVSFLEELESASLSALAIGDDMEAPALSGPFLAKADELRFPVLAIPHEVPFEAVSRAVASANSDEEHLRLVRTVKLYESLRGAVSANRLGEPLLSELEAQLECRILVLDTATGLPVIETESSVSRSLRRQVVETLRKRDGVFPGVLRIRHEDGTALVIRVPAARPTALVALSADGQGPELDLLSHAGNIVALEVARVTAEREQDMQLGGELLAQLLERRLEPGSALRRIADHGIAPEGAVLIVLRSQDPRGDADLHHELAQRGIPHFALRRAERVLLVVPDTEVVLATLRAAVGADVAFGVSDLLGRPDRLPDGAREAGWAEAAARNLGRSFVRYGESTPLFLPRTLGEAEAAADHVLGPLIAYDEEHATELVRSLDVFLEHNRSWQRSAEALFVHKQTLVYRVHRIEDLTGRDLRNTGDVVQLWLALRSLELARGELGAEPDRAPQRSPAPAQTEPGRSVSSR